MGAKRGIDSSPCILESIRRQLWLRIGDFLLTNLLFEVYKGRILLSR